MNERCRFLTNIDEGVLRSSHVCNIRNTCTMQQHNLKTKILVYPELNFSEIIVQTRAVSFLDRVCRWRRYTKIFVFDFEIYLLKIIVFDFEIYLSKNIVSILKSTFRKSLFSILRFTFRKSLFSILRSIFRKSLFSILRSTFRKILIYF